MLNHPNEPRKIAENPAFTVVRDRLMGAVSYDPGLNREIIFKPQFSDKTLRASSVLMQSRSAMIADVFDKFAAEPNSKAAFLMLDLKDMHFADKAGPNAGDYVLNSFAAALKEEVLKLRLLKHADLQNAHMDVCRYGGDEFCVTIVGDYDQDLLSNVKTVIESRFAKGDLTGYFKKGLEQDDPIEEKPIQLKQRDSGDMVEIHERPYLQEEQRLFDKFLKRGQVLSFSQVKKAEELPQLRKFIDQDIEPQYSSKGLSDSDKLNYLAIRFPQIARDVRTLNSDFYNNQQRAEARKMLEDRLFDKLFANIVYTPAEFGKRLHEYRDVYCIDLKMVREMNDVVSYPEADMAIVTLHETLRNILGPQLADRVDIGRRGGTFFIGVKKGILNSLSYASKIQEAMAKIEQLPINLRGQYVNFPLGTSYMSLGTENRNFTPEDFKDLNEAAEFSFLEKIADYLVEQRSDGRTNLDFIFSHRDFRGRDGEMRYMDSLVQEYFLSKRAIFRANKMHRILWTGSKFRGEKYNRLRVAMTKILDHAKASPVGHFNQLEVLDQLNALLNNATGA